MRLEDVVKATRNARDPKDKKIFNNAGQAWNHEFYWKSMTPKPAWPEGVLKDAIEKDFGSVGKLVEEIATAGKEQFGSGWVWLVSKRGKLIVEKTSNAETPMAEGTNCLLAIDVWEHAYYLDYQNERPNYLEAVLSKLTNWKFAADNLSKDQSAPAKSPSNGGRYEEVRQDVAKAFKRPEDIAQSSGLSRDQKIELLEQWELDLRELMVATEENMPGTEPGKTAELLSSVRVLLTKLGADRHGSAATHKHGA